MINTAPKPPRVLMKGGMWIVPESDRPCNWKSYGISEQPTEEQVAGAVADVAAQMNTADSPGFPIGSQEWHRDYARHRSAAQRQAREVFAEYGPILMGSAIYVGANERLKGFGKLLFAGMMTGGMFLLQELSGLGWYDIQQGKNNFIRSGIWSGKASALKGYEVHMGEDCEITDMGFWLNAMVGAGELFGKINEDGTSIYSANPIL